MVEEPGLEAAGFAGLELARDRDHILKGVKEIELETPEVPLTAPQAEAGLLSRGLGVDDFPKKAAGEDLGTGEEGAHRAMLLLKAVYKRLPSRARLPDETSTTERPSETRCAQLRPWANT